MRERKPAVRPGIPSCKLCMLRGSRGKGKEARGLAGSPLEEKREAEPVPVPVPDWVGWPAAGIRGMLRLLAGDGLALSETGKVKAEGAQSS